MLIKDIVSGHKKFPEESINVGEFKRQLLRSVVRILQSEELDFEEIHRAEYIFCYLRERLETRNDQPNFHVPEEFLCPISKKIMNEPVYISTVLSFDREAIRTWIDDDQRPCNLYDIIFCELDFTPHLEISKNCSQWCESRLEAALWMLSCSTLTEMKKASLEIRQLTKDSKHARDCFRNTNADGIKVLFSALSAKDLDNNIKENLVATMFNLSLGESYKKLFSDTPLVRSVLVQCLTHGNLESNMIAARTISSIVKDGLGIEKFDGALRGLVRLLRVDNMTSRDAATAIWNLCYPCKGNRRLAVENGAIDAIVMHLSENLLTNQDAISELLALFVLLKDSGKPVKELETATALLSVLKRKHTRDVSREHCVVLLLSIFKSCKKCQKLIGEEERNFKTFSNVVVNTGTPAAQEAAIDLLYLLNTLKHTIPVKKKKKKKKKKKRSISV